jgi:indole-3-glycerol phosphate synthase
MTGTYVETGTYLDRILARTAADVSTRKLKTPVAELERLAADRTESLSLSQAISIEGTSIIAEFKKASPSRGRFAVEVGPKEVAREYVTGGAAAISVLTDEPFFQGSLADLTVIADVAHAHGVPVLRKDFIIDEYQLIEARAIGADAVLLIVAALDQTALIDLLQVAKACQLETLVEVHDEAEMKRAVAAGAEIIGVNNRDLRTFDVDLATTERIANMKRASSLLVGESGIFTREDVVRLERCGVDAVLVGESLVLSENRGASIRALKGEGSLD